jgi:hypothetical protein
VLKTGVPLSALRSALPHLPVASGRACMRPRHMNAARTLHGYPFPGTHLGLLETAPEGAAVLHSNHPANLRIHQMTR